MLVVSLNPTMSLPTVNAGKVQDDLDGFEPLVQHANTEHIHVVSVPGRPSTKSASTSKSKIFCRVCWEGVREPGDMLVSPCVCSGTQRWVHTSCLKEWQKTVLSSNSLDDRAYRCGVCKTLYSISPELRGQKYRSACLKAVRLVLVLGCLFSLYCGIGNVYLWPLVGFMALVFPTLACSRGTRTYQALFLLSVLLVIVVLRFFLPYLDVKAVMTMIIESSDSTQRETGLYDAEVKPGALLISNQDVIGHSSAFSHSVVLLFSHSSSNGSQGVILNQRILSRAESLESGCFSSSSDELSECIQHDGRLADDHDLLDLLAHGEHTQHRDEEFWSLHFFGGPKFALEKLVVMHTLPNVKGSKEIALGDGRHDKVYFGGLMSDILTEARKYGSERAPIWIFHGISTWEGGQLLSEVRLGAWSVKPATLDDLHYFGLFDDIS